MSAPVVQHWRLTPFLTMQLVYTTRDAKTEVTAHTYVDRAALPAAADDQTFRDLVSFIKWKPQGDDEDDDDNNNSPDPSKDVSPSPSTSSVSGGSVTESTLTGSASSMSASSATVQGTESSAMSGASPSVPSGAPAPVAEPKAARVQMPPHTVCSLRGHIIKKENDKTADVAYAFIVKNVRSRVQDGGDGGDGPLACLYKDMCTLTLAAATQALAKATMLVAKYTTVVVIQENCLDYEDLVMTYNDIAMACLDAMLRSALIFDENAFLQAPLPRRPRDQRRRRICHYSNMVSGANAVILNGALVQYAFRHPHAVFPHWLSLPAVAPSVCAKCQGDKLVRSLPCGHAFCVLCMYHMYTEEQIKLLEQPDEYADTVYQPMQIHLRHVIERLAPARADAVAGPDDLSIQKVAAPDAAAAVPTFGVTPTLKTAMETAPLLCPTCDQYSVPGGALLPKPAKPAKPAQPDEHAAGSLGRRRRSRRGRSRKSGQRKSGQRKSGQRKSGQRKSGQRKSGQCKSGQCKSGQRMSKSVRRTRQRSRAPVSGPVRRRSLRRN